MECKIICVDTSNLKMMESLGLESDQEDILLDFCFREADVFACKPYDSRGGNYDNYSTLYFKDGSAFGVNIPYSEAKKMIR